VSPLLGAAAAGAGRRGEDPLLGALDHGLLVSVGWDPATKVLAPAREHLLLGYPVCRVVGCELEAWDPIGVRTGCQPRLRASGLDMDTFCAAGVRRRNRSRDRCCLVCRIPGFQRPVAANDLCLSCDGLRRRRGQTVAAHVGGDEHFQPARPRPSLGVCAVQACQRLAAHAGAGLCGAHDWSWRLAGRPDLAAFRHAAPPCQGDRSGRAVLAGLAENTALEVLYGVQASLAEGRRVMLPVVRGAVEHLRRRAAAGVADTVDASPTRAPVRWFLAFTADRVGLVRADVQTEQAKDVWDLRLWGAAGRLSFIGTGSAGHIGGRPSQPITQPWLKHAAKAWAAEALTTMTPGPVRAVISAVGLLSEHLARRDDAGSDPARLDHRDVQALLARLAHLQRAGRLSAAARARTLTHLARFLRDCREMGLTQPGAVLAGLGDDVVLRRAELPPPPHPENEPGRALPQTVMSQLLDPDNLALLEQMAGPTIRAAVELGAGVGRRTAELCALRLACLDHDEHTDAEGERRASPVLVHDMPKVGKLDCRLPIHDREAAIIRAQQQRITTAYPDTPPERLVLFPRPLTNPEGTRPITTSQLQRTMRAWIHALPHLDGPDRDAAGQPVPFPRDRITPYAFRHSFAQRHADAGAPVDTLKEFLGHDTIRMTLGHYRITAGRKRAAQDALGPLQIDARGRPVRPDLTGLADAEAPREQIGQVAVPFGVCTEPSNVNAHGHACPFRRHCTGCTYFRTDPSYTPELHAYLIHLLADKERLTAAVPELAEWARRDAIPTDEEIEAVRRLPRANDELLASLDDADHAAVEDAITTIRAHRARLDADFPAELAGLTRHPAPVFFPTIEQRTRAEADRG